MVEATSVGDARRDTSGLKHSWSHHGAGDADASTISLDIVTLCSDLVRGVFSVLRRAVVLCLGVVVMWCCAVVVLCCCDAVMLGLVVWGFWCRGFVMSVDVGRNILPPAGCPILLLGSTSPATLYI